MTLPTPFRLLLLCCLALTLFLGGCAVNPVTKEREFSLMSETQERRMGEEAYPLYTQASGGLFTDDDLQTYVSQLGQQLAAVSHRPNLDYEFNVVNGSEINAYALPGGKISITRGLLEKMDNEAQLAAVLGHEVGHVTARHGAAGYTRQVLAGVVTTAGMIALQSADVRGGQWLAKGGMMAVQLVQTKYGRDQERQSDELGMGYMTAASHNPEGMVQTMGILRAAHSKEPSKIEALFSSHPPSSEREETARSRLADQPAHLRDEAHLGREPFHQATGYLRQVAPAYAKAEEAKKLLAQGEGDQALALFREAVELAPKEALLHVAVAAAEREVGDDQAAVKAAEAAVSLYPGLYHARFIAGLAHFDLTNHEQSLTQLAAAEKIIAKQPQVAYFRGRNQEALGDQESAAQDYYFVLQQVKEGPMAEYAYKRLVEWGYLKPSQ